MRVGPPKMARSQWRGLKNVSTAEANGKPLQYSCLETPWTAAYQAPSSMGFSRQEYWSGVPLPSPIIGYTWPLLHSPSPSVKNQTFIEHLYAALLEVWISKLIRQNE